ncbi:hypothetical protein YC2023_010624 [Brassica napus]
MLSNHPYLKRPAKRTTELDELYKYHEPVDQQSNKNMIGQPMIPHSFNIHHPSQVIPQTHTGQRQAYTNKIHTKPNPVPKPDLGLNVRTCKQSNQQPQPQQ